MPRKAGSASGGKILIIGKGYLGTRCAQSWDDAVITDKIVETVEDVEKLIDEHQPDTILNAAGIVGKPNVDWCETHQVETYKGNTLLPLIIAETCQKKGVYLLHMGTGCIFYGTAPDNQAWTEEDYANPVAVYTRCKYAADLVLSKLPNIGVARIRIPLDCQPHPANLIDKLASYPKIVDVENSITVVEDMIDVFHQLLEKKAEGIYHVTNPGSIKWREIMEMYKKYVDPSHSNDWISEGELVELGLADKKRSNNVMTSLNLPKLGIKMRPVKEAVEDAIKKYRDSKK
ncbi:MAG: sugar nucleotide-binding protein [Patescibacteria group bacterium]|nr:sugar nucleotide-binding protein [Patescibacteria group bacterium]